MAGRQFVNTAENREWIRNVTERQIGVQGVRIYFRGEVRMLAQSLQLRAKDKTAPRSLRVIKRFFPGAVARDEQFAVTLVPDRKRKHAAQVVDAIVAIFFESMNDCFGIRV